MKLTSIFLFAAFLQVSAKSYTQTVTLNFQNAPLEKVLKEIEKQAGYNFFYEKEILQNTKPVTIAVSKYPIDQTLAICFKEQPLEYKIVQTTIFIKRKEEINVEQKEIASSNFGDINGRVTNEQGEPLSEANVIIKRTGTGTITDANGQFTLRNINSDDVVYITYIGYTPLTIKVGSKTNFNVIMKIAVNKLDEAVVQGYGKTTQRLATGNIGRVTSEDIEKQPAMNPLIALQGRIAGLSLVQTSGYESGTIKIEIRGRNSINPSMTSEPLYIIDGVPLTILDVSGNSNYQSGSRGFVLGGISSSAGGQSPFFSINPADIESIEVLKDADATAIYGSRGANGVILITTKKGKAGKSNFDLTVQSGVSEVPKFYPLLNTEQYVSMRTEALKNDGLNVNINSAADLLSWDTTRYTNWQKYVLGGTGKKIEIDASLSGGTVNTSYRISGSFTQQTGVLTVSGSNKRASLSTNITQTSNNKKLKLGLTINNSYAIIDEIGTAPSMILTVPNAPSVYDSLGNLNYSGWIPLQSRFPFSSFLQPYTAKTNFLNTGLDISYQLIKGLYLKSSIGYNHGVNKQTRFIYQASQDPKRNPVGTSNFGYALVDNLIFEPQIEYDKFILKGKLTSLVGASNQINSTEAVDNVGYGYTNDALMGTISAAPQIFSNAYYGQYKYAAVFARINYNWKERYILNLNARRDGSSRFGPGRQFGNFGSIGAAYIFSETNFVKESLRWLSFGKLRMSYGTTGSDNISDYRYLSYWNFSSLAYNNTPTLIPQGHSDSLIQWQVNKKAEVALDLGFFGRFNLEAVFYRDRCNNQLIDFPLPNFTGFNAVTSNLPANVENKGWEFVLNSKLIDNRKLKWDIAFNVGINRNKLISYPNLDQSPYKDVFVIGQPLNMRKLLHNTGVNPQTGLYTFEDINKDGKVTLDFTGKTQDDRSLYNLDTKFSGGLTTNLSYNNWDLSVLFYFKKFNRLNIYSSIDIPGSLSNSVTDVLNHWQKPGDIATFAKYTTRPSSDPSFSYYKNFSDGIYSDGSFLRLQNVQISYSLPQSMRSRLGLNSLKLYLRGQNLFTITNYKGIDPEIPGLLVLPTLRKIIVGLSINL